MKKKTTYKRSGAKYSWNNNLVTGSLYCDLVLLLFLIKKIVPIATSIKFTKPTINNMYAL